MIDQKSTSGGLSRSLAILLAGFVLVSSLALAAWTKYWNQRQEIEAFQQLAINNAAFIEQMRLPRSQEMAKRLASVLDLGVGFRFENGEQGEWPPKLETVIEELTSKPEAAVKITNSYDIATAPVGESGTHLILVRNHQDSENAFANGVLIPAMGLAFVSGIMGLVMARTVVQPLGSLTNWLPNLDIRPDSVPDSIPTKVLDRKDEIGKLAKALAETATKLREEQRLRQQSERLATLGKIATSLAHEIKNPAAAIRLHADLLNESLQDTEQVSITLIQEEVDRITDLVNQWLYVAKTKPGKRETHELGQLLKSVSQRLTPQLEHAKVELDLKIQNEAYINADGPRLEQALRNPLLNALQAMPKGGTIEVILKVEEEKAILTIKDEGIGFSTAAIEHFGEPFYSEKEGGMGIGLTLAKEVLEAHGGSIHPENGNEGGAMIICEIPIVKDPAK